MRWIFTLFGYSLVTTKKKSFNTHERCQFLLTNCTDYNTIHSHASQNKDENPHAELQCIGYDKSVPENPAGTL